MITLYQPKPVWNVPSMSPFCVKLETYLRMTKLEYQSRAGNPFKGPKQKVPYIKIDGRVMGDSSLIIAYLKQTRGNPLDEKLTEQQQAQALALQRLIEEHLYFAAAWLRWNSPESLPYVKAVFLELLPPVMGRLIFPQIRKRFLRGLNSQGMGRHTRAEIIQLACDDLAAIAVLLGAGPYVFGSEPSAIDAALFGFLVQLFGVPWRSPVTDFARGQKHLLSYTERMRQRYWTELRPYI